MSAPDPNLQVKIDGKQVSISDVFEVDVHKDLNEPDMCSISISNVKGSMSGSLAQGAKIEVSAQGASPSLFTGEVTGLEPTFDYGLPSRCTIRALNLMHRLARGKKSKTFEKMSDHDIATKVCQDAGVGLSAKCDGPASAPKHDHVYQHNQTDLQFLRQRAARIDYEVMVEDKTFYFRKRQEQDSGVSLSFGDGSLERFRPRMAGSVQVNKVVVRGWDPIKRKEIKGVASAEAKFGQTAGPSAFSSANMSQTETVETDRPIYTQDEADNLAKALLKEKQMQFIQGDVMTHGIPNLKPGMTIQIDVGDSRFNGKYYISSVRHRFVHSVGGAGGMAHREAGFRTYLHVMRDSQSEPAPPPEQQKQSPREQEQQRTNSQNRGGGDGGGGGGGGNNAGGGGGNNAGGGGGGNNAGGGGGGGNNAGGGGGRSQSGGGGGGGQQQNNQQQSQGGGGGGGGGQQQNNQQQSQGGGGGGGQQQNNQQQSQGGGGGGQQQNNQQQSQNGGGGGGGGQQQNNQQQSQSGGGGGGGGGQQQGEQAKGGGGGEQAKGGDGGGGGQQKSEQAKGGDGGGGGQQKSEQAKGGDGGGGGDKQQGEQAKGDNAQKSEGAKGDSSKKSEQGQSSEGQKGEKGAAKSDGPGDKASSSDGNQSSSKGSSDSGSSSKTSETKSSRSAEGEARLNFTGFAEQFVDDELDDTSFAGGISAYIEAQPAEFLTVFLTTGYHQGKAVVWDTPGGGEKAHLEAKRAETLSVFFGTYLRF